MRGVGTSMAMSCARAVAAACVAPTVHACAPELKLFGASHLPCRRGATGLEDDAPHLPRHAMNGVEDVTISSAGATW
jgi:hypothetical protein